MPIDLGTESAFILAGGRGERLRPLTDTVPKVMIDVQGKPLIQYNIELFARYGVKKIVVGTGYLGEKIERQLGDGNRFGISIEYCGDDELKGTAGALKFAEKYFKNTFFMCNGDEVKEIDLAGMLAIHRKNNAIATIALTKVQDVSEFGVIELAENNRIVRFVEKPKPEHAPSNLINAGLYILEPEIFKFIPEGKSSIERDVFPKVADAGKLYGFEFSGQWFPTDTPERLEKARAEWKG